MSDTTEKIYCVPDFSKWEGIKTVKEEPLYKCENCKANTWCKYAPWVSGCDENFGRIDESNIG